MDNYSVEQPLPAEAWNALDEGERILLVQEAHQRTGAPTGASPEAHAAIHVAIENRLADGDAAVTRAYDRFRAAGVHRHNTVHALASVVSRHMLAIMEGQTPDEAASIRDFDALDPATFSKNAR